MSKELIEKIEAIERYLKNLQKEIKTLKDRVYTMENLLENDVKQKIKEKIMNNYLDKANKILDDFVDNKDIDAMIDEAACLYSKMMEDEVKSNDEELFDKINFITAVIVENIDKKEV